ncbi:MAG: hypothetical protein Q7W45_17490 [Bacteroidota bacterium]|nr:hypothetical protein [Bacteroidota bacterium]MDP3145189.1 hypothetical protein [Bacteroidota bacterium]MDP3557285.1 hypothetical protein [Bacteroidota bacterium]
MERINFKIKKAKIALIKKAIAFILLCVLLIVLDKVYTLNSSDLGSQLVIVNK